jgi:hypothetical protein
VDLRYQAVESDYNQLPYRRGSVNLIVDSKGNHGAQV